MLWPSKEPSDCEATFWALIFAASVFSKSLSSDPVQLFRPGGSAAETVSAAPTMIRHTMRAIRYLTRVPSSRHSCIRRRERLQLFDAVQSPDFAMRRGYDEVEVDPTPPPAGHVIVPIRAAAGVLCSVPFGVRGRECARAIPEPRHLLDRRRRWCCDARGGTLR